MKPAEAMNIITLESLQILVYCDKVSSWVLPLRAGVVVVVIKFIVLTEPYGL